MLRLFQSFIKNLPTLILALALAVAVWISAVTAADPSIRQTYPRPISIEITGQDPGLVLTSEIPSEAEIALSAPTSTWDALLAEPAPIRAVVDLSGLAAGVHVQPVQVQIQARAVQLVDHSPKTISVVLEPLATKNLPVGLQMQGEPAVGYAAETPSLDVETVTISGAESSVSRVARVQVVLDISQARENIARELTLTALDEDGNPVTSVAITPQQVNITALVNNRGGYRNVVVKVAVSGQIASGYRLTNISAFPPAVTVFSTNPQVIEDLPGYVETASLDLTGAKDDLDVRLPLELPDGVSVVGEQTVTVQVGIAAIESSLTLSAMRVEVVGLEPGQAAKISPETVDVILSGPLPLLDSLTKDDVRVIVEMDGEGFGTYQRVPRVEIKINELRVELILPGTVEVTIIRAPPATATPQP